MRIVYAGTGEIGVPSLHRLVGKGFDVAGVVTQPDRPAGRRQELLPSPVKHVAIGLGVTVYQPEKINDPSFLGQLKSLQPDLLVVCAYGQILKPALLGLPRLGCLNIHASLLPRYRGAACIQGAIRSGDTETGVTIMWMDAGLDTGDILLKKALPIFGDDTAGSLHDRLAAIAPDALEEALGLIANGEAPRWPQDNSQATYVGRLKKEDGRMDWSLSAEELDRHIRAMTPWPSAFTGMELPGGKRMLKVFKASMGVEGGSARPGEVLCADSGGISVATGKGCLLLREVQLEGRHRLPVADFLRGVDLVPGTILG